jgi:regulator of sigma E protease
VGEGDQAQTIPRLGVLPRVGPMPWDEAIMAGVTEPFALSWMALTSIGEMIIGDRSTEELGGPLRIAQISGEVASVGLIATLWWMAALSINLGLINLFPIPMLDGGHLMFYAIEAVRGRPLGVRAQEIAFRIGLSLILALLVFATVNDVIYNM